MKKLVVLTGAGISAESGINTFRDADGLWEGHDIMEVASPQGFRNNPELVLDFYNQRRRQLFDVSPNEAHFNLKKLEDEYEVHIITQNVDDLHERAKSSHIIHLHGELLKAKSSISDDFICEWTKDINIGDKAKDGSQLRPYIVWFGEDVPMIPKAVEIVEQADIFVIIGTSMQVYPAASLINFIEEETPIYFIDPKPMVNKNAFNNLTIIKDVASLGTKKLLELLNVSNH
ncbi:Sir2 family NAD-dependent protein deacetylase [Tenacibaculum jejuense]|uniref:protein acetyllysine N-acetyltransferase n=1 Tax=Tenacibaculum jejuense TaxID=584609 RepID=A0A238UAH8_9FLAO|nr:Sir2 family NAD-dependent protein deacetylase [Tenacibaculum jejuense]SNR16181.1 NAD-dependent protein deacylase [Tenacibaculum jejuense]